MSKNAETKVSTHDDGKFIRTALVMQPNAGEKTGSIVLLDEDGKEIGLLNIFFLSDRGADTLMVDLIDRENRYPIKRGLTFEPYTKLPSGGTSGGERKIIETKGMMVCAHFERSKK